MTAKKTAITGGSLCSFDKYDWDSHEKKLVKCMLFLPIQI